MYDYRGIKKYRVRFANGKKTTVYTDEGMDDAKQRARTQIGLLTARTYDIVRIARG
jgi:hypothetical protein